MKYIILLGLVACMIFASCGEAQEDTVLTYSRTSGFTGWEESLRLYTDGTVVYVDAEGQETTMQATERTQSLVSYVGKLNAEDYEEKYFCKKYCPTDLPVTSITFDGKKISIYVPENLPEELVHINREMLAVYGTL